MLKQNDESHTHVSSYVIAYEGLTSIDGDVERVISTRQRSPPSYAVSVPQLQTAERCRVLLDTYLVDEHVRRCGHPRQVAQPHVAYPANPLSVTLTTIVECPDLGARKRPLRLRISCTQKLTVFVALRYAIQRLSYRRRLSVRPSVRHTLTMHQNYQL